MNVSKKATSTGEIKDKGIMKFLPHRDFLSLSYTVPQLGEFRHENNSLIIFVNLISDTHAEERTRS